MSPEVIDQDNVSVDERTKKFILRNGFHKVSSLKTVFGHNETIYVCVMISPDSPAINTERSIANCIISGCMEVSNESIKQSFIDFGYKRKSNIRNQMIADHYLDGAKMVGDLSNDPEMLDLR